MAALSKDNAGRWKTRRSLEKPQVIQAIKNSVDRHGKVRTIRILLYWSIAVICAAVLAFLEMN